MLVRAAYIKSAPNLKFVFARCLHQNRAKFKIYFCARRGGQFFRFCHKRVRSVVILNLIFFFLRNRIHRAKLSRPRVPNAVTVASLAATSSNRL